MREDYKSKRRSKGLRMGKKRMSQKINNLAIFPPSFRLRTRLRLDRKTMVRQVADY